MQMEAPLLDAASFERNREIAVHAVVLPTTLASLLSSPRAAWKGFWNLMATSTSTEYLRHSQSRRRFIWLKSCLFFILMVAFDLGSGQSVPVLIIDLAAGSGLVVTSLFVPPHSSRLDVLICSQFVLYNLMCSLASLKMRDSLMTGMISDLLVVVSFLSLCGIHFGGVIVTHMLLLVSDLSVASVTIGCSLIAVRQLLGVAVVVAVFCIIVELHHTSAIHQLMANERLLPNGSHGHLSIDLQSGTITGVSDSLVCIFDGALQGLLFADLPQAKGERPVISIQDLISAYERRDGVCFATFDVPSKSVFDCRLVPYLMTSGQLQVFLQVEGELRQRPSISRSTFIDSSGNAQHEVVSQSSHDKLSMDSFVDYVLHEAQQVALLEGLGQGTWGALVSESALRVAEQVLQDVEVDGSEMQKREAVARSFKQFNDMVTRCMQTAIARGGFRHLDDRVAVWRIQHDEIGRIEAERDRIIDRRWKDVRAAYLALWRHRYIKILVSYNETESIAWDLVVRGRVIVEVVSNGPSKRAGIQPGDLLADANAHSETSRGQVLVFSKEPFPEELLERIIIFLGCPVGWHTRRRSQLGPRIFARTLMHYENLSWLS